MANAAGLSGDHALRGPMSWTADPDNAGFSAVTPFRSLATNSTTQNVALETGDGSSLLSYYTALMRLRADYPVIGAGTLDVPSAVNDPVLLLTRSTATECAAIMINYSNQPQPVSVATNCANATFNRVFGANEMTIADASGTITATIAARTAAVYHADRV
jgi:glycosidase